MRKGIRGTLAAAILAATCGVAHADWAFTRWGMTQDQVAAASGGRVQRIPMASISCVFEGTTCGARMSGYVIGPYRFDVLLGFDQQARLNSVLLRANPSQFYELERALVGTFGQPLAANGGPFPARIWRDGNQGNRIRLISLLGSDTLIEYKPITTGF